MNEVLNISKAFGKNVFDDVVTKDRLPKNVYRKLKKAIENDAELGPSIADVVVHAMKDWATEGGVIHYTHWLQPPTGVTIEKHDSFISALNDGRIIMEFSGKELIKGESDASSLPSGGLRTTFKARGYTTRGCSSPAFLKEDTISMAPCVPTSFCSYKGESLDRKIPLLRPMWAVNEQALRVLRLLGNTTAKRVVPSVEAEQEYLLVGREKYLQHEDLIYTGYILFGAIPPKEQKLEDHYFGATRERIGSYMSNVDKELWKLGVPARTQHNGMALAQHEMALIYEEVNRTVDRNQIAMETLKKIAGRHGMVCLLREKPFTDVNGSGKHNNWLLTAGDGTNFLSPGDTPHENTQFLLVLACVIRAIDVHIDLLKESAVDVGNGRRLGVNEAPPAIISIFLGEQPEDVIDQLYSTEEAIHSKKGGTLKAGADILPNLDRDAMDRNRISPSASTGNKFEFHMVGPSDSIASPNAMLNIIVAKVSREAADKLEKAGDFSMAVYGLVKETLPAHRRIIFNGNSYADEWVVEVEQRGLPSIRSMISAIPALTIDKAVELFGEFCVFTRAELESRAEVEYENYSEATSTGTRTVYGMVSKSIMPAMIKYTIGPMASVTAVKSTCPDADVSTQTESLLETPDPLGETRTALPRLAEMTEKAAAVEGGKTQTLVYHQDVVPAMTALRAPMGQLKMIVDREL